MVVNFYFSVQMHIFMIFFLISSAPTAVPTNFKVRAISSTIVNVTWDPPPIYDQNGIITNYTFTYRGVERDTKLVTYVIPVVNGSSYDEPVMFDLEENTEYMVTVRASTIVGNGPVASLEVLTPEEG